MANIFHGKENLISVENKAPSISILIGVYLLGIDFIE
jgi:hypothetical protein